MLPTNCGRQFRMSIRMFQLLTIRTCNKPNYIMRKHTIFSKFGKKLTGLIILTPTVCSLAFAWIEDLIECKLLYIGFFGYDYSYFL